jgi:RHS repeat-associated protein
MGSVSYDPWGNVESGTLPTFGFTGEMQDVAAGLVYLSARWYSAGHGTFTAYRWRNDENDDEIPYSHHPYAYALSNPGVMLPTI